MLAAWEADRPAIERIRREVFIREQKIPESDEWDGEDAASVHVLATLNREPVGTGRLNPAGKIGRIAVMSGLRGRGIGTSILPIRFACAPEIVVLGRAVERQDS